MQGNLVLVVGGWWLVVGGLGELHLGGYRVSTKGYVESNKITHIVNAAVQPSFLSVRLLLFLPCLTSTLTLSLQSGFPLLSERVGVLLCEVGQAAALTPRAGGGVLQVHSTRVRQAQCSSLPSTSYLVQT